MNLLVVVVVSAVILFVAYYTYGTLLARLAGLDPKTVTPAVELQDGIDFDPLNPSSLVPQHFSAIAAAGPIVGPILAGMTFGWLPALLWILIGSVFIGGTHDFFALVASVRHKAKSIAEVVRDHMSQRAYLLFLSFIWIALIYIIVAFTDITSRSFIGAASAEAGGVTGAAIATSSTLYLMLTLVMGLCLKYLKTPLSWTTAVFIVLTGFAIWIGPKFPMPLGDYFGLSQPQQAKMWDVILLVYCLLAGVAPVWLILQPRGQLGGYFLYFALGAGALGLILGGGEIKYPAIMKTAEASTLFPMLFITIACGACSGFHSLIASGTTSKQLRTETDAKVVGYGTMLLEGMVAIVSLCCVMMFAAGSPELSSGSPNMIYAAGIAKFLQTVGIDPVLGTTFALLAFTTFIYDTLDVCTRLGRFILQELTGMHGLAGRCIGTTLTAGLPLYFLLRHPDTINGVPAPAVYKMFWPLFGASNQLLAALTLLGITVWLWKTRKAAWVWAVTGLPTVWMYAMSSWALWTLTVKSFYVPVAGQPGKFELVLTSVVGWAGVVLLFLAILMLIEAIIVLLSLGKPSTPSPTATGYRQPVTA